MNEKITVIKQDPHGIETWRWQGQVLQRREGFVLLKAVMNAEQSHMSGPLLLNPGDNFHEYHYANRWYNIFEVHAGDGEIKGWYCNLAMPAEIFEHEIRFRDLALDLVVMPDGSQAELDWDEFEALEISKELRAAALRGWHDLLEHFATGNKKDPR